MTSLYVRRTGRIHALRPHIADTEWIDGDTTAVVRPYLVEQGHADQAGAAGYEWTAAR